MYQQNVVCTIYSSTSLLASCLRRTATFHYYIFHYFIYILVLLHTSPSPEDETAAADLRYDSMLSASDTFFFGKKIEKKSQQPTLDSKI
jgi:hypothetical protein